MNTQQLNDILNSITNDYNQFCLEQQSSGVLPTQPPPQPSPLPQQANDTKKAAADFRAITNNKIGDFIFSNPASHQPPMIPRHNDPFVTDRINLQEKSKINYKDLANQRLNQFNPIARAMHFPVAYNLDAKTNNVGLKN